MGKRVGLLVALMVLLVVSGGILYYVNNQSQADELGVAPRIAEASVVVPDNGLAIKVVGSDGVTALTGAKVGVIAIDTTNAAALAKFAVPTAYRNNLISDVVSNVEQNVNITQNVLTDTGLAVVSGMESVSDVTYGPRVVWHSANDLTYDFPAGSANVGSNGMKYYDQTSFTVTDSSTATVKILTPVRVYIDYNGTKAVKNLILADKTGSLASDYTYDSAKALSANSVTVTLPVMPPVVVTPPTIVSLNEGAPGLTFRVLNLDNKPLAGANIRGQLLGYAAKNTYPLANFEKTSDVDGMVTLSVTDIENILKTNANSQTIDFTKPVYVSYECSLNNSYYAPNNGTLPVRVGKDNKTVSKVLSWADVLGITSDNFRVDGHHKAAYRYALRLDNLRTVTGTTTSERAYGEVIHLSAMAQ